MRDFYSTVRAQWRGSAGLTVLVGCVCGRKLYLSRRLWAGRGVTICGSCLAVIVYGSLLVVNPQDAEEFMAGVIRGEEERGALLGDIEAELRRFVSVFDSQPEWLWSPATVKLVQAVRPKLELLGGPIEAAGAGPGVMPEAAFKGRGEWHEDDEEEDAA